MLCWQRKAASAFGSWDDTEHAGCNRPQLAEGEIIRLWGTVRERAMYRGPLGRRAMLPLMEAAAVEQAR